jgi:hypothetical protein
MGGASVDRPPSLIYPRGGLARGTRALLLRGEPLVLMCRASGLLRRRAKAEKGPLRMGHDFFREGLLQRKSSLAGAWVPWVFRGIFETALLEIR